MKSVRKVGKNEPVGRVRFSFAAKVWLYEGPAAWYFLDLPKELSIELDNLFADQKRGFGSLRVEAGINGVTWQTSIFPSSERHAYMLPLKAKVRKQAGIDVGDNVDVVLQIII